jgi:hypothetical protein
LDKVSVFNHNYKKDKEEEEGNPLYPPGEFELRGRKVKSKFKSNAISTEKDDTPEKHDMDLNPLGKWLPKEIEIKIST